MSTMPRDADHAALIALVDRRLPDEALAVTDGTRAFLAWPTYAGEQSRTGTARVAYSDGTQPPWCDAVTMEMPLSLTLDAISRMAGKDRDLGLVILREQQSRSTRPGDPDRLAAIAAITRHMDARATVLMERLGLMGGPELAWLASGREGSDAVHAFATLHPWLVPAAVAAERVAVGAGRSTVADTALRDGPEAAALRTLRLLGPSDASHHARGLTSNLDNGATDEAELAYLVGAASSTLYALRIVSASDEVTLKALLGRMRHVRHPQTWNEVGIDHVAGLLRIPLNLFPPPVSADTDDDGMQDHLSVVTLAPLVGALCFASGRDARSILGRVDGWGEYALALSRRAGINETADDFQDDWGVVVPSDVVSNLYDLVRAFGAEVLAPALTGRGSAWTGPFSEGSAMRILPDAIHADAVMAASARFLLGQGTLPALCEMSAKWHARSDAIARIVAGLAGPDAPVGPALFEDLDLGDGWYATCLTSTADLLDEGAPGPDANGVPGLSHCVGGYGPEVAAGETAIVSLRRRLPGGGFERVSTAEVNFPAHRFDRDGVVQHQARGNATPSEEATIRLMRALDAVTDTACDRLGAFEPDPATLMSTAELVVREGAWDRMRDAWAFAMTRPQRSMDMAGILREAGIPNGID